MDNIFIDTSIFEENNFLESKRINEILKLSEESYIRIVLPEVTYEEILIRISKNVDEAFEKFNRYRRDTRVLRNSDSLKSKFEVLDKEKTISEIIEKIKKRFKDSKVTIVPYPILNIKDIFHSYYNKEKPFSEGVKKDEFPDAFALISMEKWCKEKGTTCLVFANDRDLIHYESDVIKPVDYKEYLDLKLSEIEVEKQREARLEAIKEQFLEHEDNFISEIDNWVYQELDDRSKYHDYTNYLELHELDIQDIEVDILDFKITSITDREISFQSDVDISYEVEIVTDDEDYAMYDDDEGSWVYIETRTEKIKRNKIIKVDFIYQIPAAGENFAELQIEEINQGKDLKI